MEGGQIHDQMHMLQEEWDSTAAELSARFKLAKQHQQQLPAARPEAVQRPCRPREEPQAMLASAQAEGSQCGDSVDSNISAQERSACSSQSSCLRDHAPWLQQPRLQHLHGLTASLQVRASHATADDASGQSAFICTELGVTRKGVHGLAELSATLAKAPE